jgi:Carboxypeptidase regulatory-like domain
MHRKRWIIVLATITTVTTIATASIFSRQAPAGQEPAAPQESKNATPESSSTTKGKRSHANELLIRGTVFNEHGIAMRGVKLRIQRGDAKKPRRETYSNFRGEFAVRVPKGADYQIAAEITGFAKQSQAVNGKDGAAEEKIIFHLEPVKGGKP